MHASKVNTLEIIDFFIYNRAVIGDWPSGKALGSGPRIGGSNPSSPATMITKGDRNARTFIEIINYEPLGRISKR